MAEVAKGTMGSDKMANRAARYSKRRKRKKGKSALSAALGKRSAY